MQAVARGREHVKKPVQINEEDVRHAVQVLSVLMKATEVVFLNSGKDQEDKEADQIVELLKNSKKGYTLSQIRERLSMTRTTVQRRLNMLVEHQEVRKQKESSNTVGRSAWLYFGVI